MTLVLHVAPEKKIPKDAWTAQEGQGRVRCLRFFRLRCSVVLLRCEIRRSSTKLFLVDLSSHENHIPRATFSLLGQARYVLTLFCCRGTPQFPTGFFPDWILRRQRRKSSLGLLPPLRDQFTNIRQHCFPFLPQLLSGNLWSLARSSSTKRHPPVAYLRYLLRPNLRGPHLFLTSPLRPSLLLSRDFCCSPLCRPHRGAWRSISINACQPKRLS